MPVATLALTGLMLASCGTQPSAAEIVQKMQDTVAKTQSAHVVVSFSGGLNGDSANATLGGTTLKDMQGNAKIELWYGQPNLIKAKILEASEPKLVGAMVVHDGSYIWAWDPNSKMAYKIDSQGLRDLAGQANIPANLQDLLADPNVEKGLDQLLGLTDYKLGPNEKVGAYQTYRLDFVPKAGSPVASVLPDAKGTLWVDQDTWLPVKATVDAKQGKGQMEVSVLDLKTPLDKTTFQFVMPEQGGKTVDLSGLTPRTMTLAEARTTAQTSGYRLLEPTYLPAGSTLVQVMASKGIMGNGASAVQTYSSPAGTLWVSQINGKEMFGHSQKLPDGGQSVTVRGVQGTFASQSEKDSTTTSSVLWWHEPGTGLTVALGGPFSQAELLKIAEGLK
jgi:outer membrane lipoprotein-sorting protein